MTLYFRLPDPREFASVLDASLESDFVSNLKKAAHYLAEKGTGSVNQLTKISYTSTYTLHDFLYDIIPAQKA